jgi:hypothetical protein
MQKKKILGTLTLISIILTVTFVSFTAGIDSKPSKSTDPNSATYYFTGGLVIIQLPPGGGALANRPTCIRLLAMKLDERSTFGAADILNIAVWNPAQNKFVGCGSVRNVPAADAEAYYSYTKSYFSGTPFWNPAAGMQNLNAVSPEDLKITGEPQVARNSKGVDKVTIVLNKEIPITLTGALASLSFTLPPLTMEFYSIAKAHQDEQSITKLVPSPPLSGYTITEDKQEIPAWVKVFIPTWTTTNISFQFSGEINVRGIMSITPP